MAKLKLEDKLIKEFDIQRHFGYETPFIGYGELKYTITTEEFCKAVPFPHRKAVADVFKFNYSQGLFCIQQGVNFWICPRSAFKFINEIDIWG